MNKKILIILIILIGIIAVVLIGGHLKQKEGKKAEYPAPSVYYAMDNTHEVAMHPNGKELYVTSIHVPLIVIVDIDSADYPVLGEIKLPGGDLVSTPDIVFSHDGAYAYMVRNHNEEYIASWGLENASYIVVINATERKIDRIISPPYKLWTSLVPSSDGRWLYFTTQPHLGKSAGIGKLTYKMKRLLNSCLLATIAIFSLLYPAMASISILPKATIHLVLEKTSSRS